MEEKSKEKRRIKQREYYLKNREHILAKAAEYRKAHRKELNQYFKRRYADNREKLLADMKEYREAHREEKIKYLRDYYSKNKEELLKRQYKKKKEKLRTDPNFKLKEQARLLVWRSFNQKGEVKPARAEAILGCSLDGFTEYLKRTWSEEYHTEWVGQPCHIDHIKPLALAKTKEEIVQLCHYTNLRLLTPEDNIKKGREDYFLARKTMVESKRKEKYSA